MKEIETKINLLPWREDHLSFENRKFGLVAGIIFVVGILCSFAMTAALDIYNHALNKDVRYLESEISGLRVQIREIKGLKTQKEILLKKMMVIHELQSDRLNIVKLFNNLAESVPDSIFLNQVTRRNNSIEIKGVSENNPSISRLMRNLESHNILTDTDLNKIEMTSDGDLKFVMETSWKR